jgi:ribosomal protein S27E
MAASISEVARDHEFRATGGLIRCLCDACVNRQAVFSERAFMG